MRFPNVISKTVTYFTRNVLVYHHHRVHKHYTNGAFSHEIMVSQLSATYIKIREGSFTT